MVISCYVSLYGPALTGTLGSIRLGNCDLLWRRGLEVVTMDGILILDAARGIYLPHAFTQQFALADVDGIEEEVYEILEEGPSNPDYWECWEETLQNATVCDDDNNEYRLELGEDGDVFAIPTGRKFTSPR